MGYVARSEAKPGGTLFADVRGKRIAVAVTELPFVKLEYKREYKRDERPRAENSPSC
jgi:glycine cleavage system aminomethyltransferase T